jgi:retinol-binding protein 3
MRLLCALLPLMLTSAAAWAQLPPDDQPDIPVAPNTVDRLLEATLSAMKESYVFPERMPEIEKAIRRHLRSGEYESLKTAVPLLERVNHDVREVAQDRHLRIVYYAKPLAPPGQSEGFPAAELERDATGNFGFQRAELLDGNIGYLDLRFFPYAAEAGETAAAALGFLAHTKALILDVRHNHGGDGATVALILSYFFGPEPVHLNDMYWRPDGSTQQSWTQPYVPGHRYAGDLYVLTGPDTFSAGEELAYDLQAQHRACIVGQATGGGAHPITFHRVDDHFAVLVPSGRSINPITHTDWEGQGVQPDVRVDAEQALAKAQALALAKVRPAAATPK